jgi:hypothetical protein
MPSASRRAIRFVRALLPHFEAKPGPDGRFAAMRDGKTVTLEALEVAALLRAVPARRRGSGCAGNCSRPTTWAPSTATTFAAPMEW